jgi:F-type H+-transporting ATPase subunit b
LENLGINLGYLIVQILNFIILFLVLKRWVYEPVTKVLAKRSQTIADGIENARVAAEERANAEQQASKIITEAQARAADIVREATNRADTAAQDVKNAAEAEAAKIRESANAEAEKAKEGLLEKMRPQIITLAMSATQKLIGETLDEKRQRALLGEFFSGVKEKKVLLLQDAGGASGEEAEVVSALPLTSDEQSVVKSELLAKSGAKTINFRVDPSILGGLIIKVGDRVMDGSVSAQMENLRHSLS